MVKILLTSDIHLGVDNENSPVPEELRLKTFKKLIYLARSHNLLIIAGDLFHDGGVNENVTEIAAAEFKSLRESGVGIIISPGENEFDIKDTPLLSRLNLSKIFSDSDSISPYHFAGEDQDIYIYGLPASGTRSFSDIRKNSDSGFHIGLFHADFYLSGGNKPSTVRTLNKEDISALKLDFYALGHNHQFKLFKSGGRYIGANPGSPEAVSFYETGDRYCLSISIKDDEIFQIKRLTVNSAKLENIVLDCSLHEDLDSMLKSFNEKKSIDSILKLTLTGNRNFKIDAKVLEELGNECLSIYVDDKSIPGINLFTAEFAGEKSLRGEFFSILDEKIKNSDIPANIDLNILSELLNKIINSGHYTLEDLCNYLNA